MKGYRFKQVLIIRRDIKMGRGKLAVQAAHAAVTSSENARRNFVEWWQAWMSEGQCKVAVRVESIEELNSLKQKAEEQQLPYALIEDRGLTQLEPGTVTCLGIGPAPTSKIDAITGHLRLL
jgi:PTH2 family peptidyl-tRNA hydrolase